MLTYKIIKQRNPLDENKEEMFYARLTDRQKCDLDDVAEIISSRSSLTKSDIVATLMSLEDIIPKLLIAGSTVQLGKLGTFSLHSKVATYPKKSQVTWRSFLKLMIRFRPGKALKIRLQEVNFRLSSKG